MTALKDNGTVVSWGIKVSWGDHLPLTSPLTDVVKVVPMENLFAALKKDGSLVGWFHGHSQTVVADEFSSGVTDVFASGRSYTVVKEDGSVYAWRGGKVAPLMVSGEIHGGVKSISSDMKTVLSHDGSVVVWDEGFYSELKVAAGAKAIFSSRSSVAVIMQDGRVEAWGKIFSGGDTSEVANDLRSGVIDIFATRRAFFARKLDGTLVAWGRLLTDENDVLIGEKIEAIQLDFVLNPPQ